MLVAELTIGRADLNDSAFHVATAGAIVERVTHGQSALDFWMPQWSFGYPVLRVYQPLGAWLLALAQIATGQHFPLVATFAFLKWFLISIFPLTVYAACRLMSLDDLSAAAAALVSPLISSPNLFGLDWASYLWRGNGLYTQLVAMHLFVLAIGFGVRAIRSGRGSTLAGLFIALTILAHLIYGYMAAATIVLAAVMERRGNRLLWIGGVAFGLNAFQLLPMMFDAAYINHSRWEPSWKWQSFGLLRVLELLLTGQIVGPVIALFAAIGAWYATREKSERFFVAAAALWLFLFCGPVTWGPLFKILGIGDQVQTHRFVGGAQWFLIVLGGIGLGRLWSRNAVWIVASCVLLLFPIAGRIRYAADNANWGRANLVAYERNRADIERTIALLKTRGGRTYPGLAATWGNRFKIGYVPFHAFLSRERIPAIAFLYHAMALPADIMVRFDERRPDHFRLFDIRTVLADAGRPLPQFLNPIARFGSLRVLGAPPSSNVELVNVRYSIYADRRNFYDVNDAWLQSAWPAAREHLLIDYESTKAKLPRLPRIEMLASPPPPQKGGQSYALLKSTFHPGWRATVDGRPAEVVMLTPGFAAVKVSPGRHVIQFRYDHGAAKPILLALAIPFLIGSFVVEKKQLPPLPFSIARFLPLLLIVPVIAPLLGDFATSGHDALEYVPRLAEFHENIRHGILVPRWAPDLSSGQGQPLFLFNPPLFYYVAEIWYAIGFGLARAINLAVATFIIASAASMFLLARYWFGRPAAWLATVAYIYAPYFLVDVYVRAAFAELSAFPFYPLALYGFSRHAEERRTRDLAIGCVAYAGVWFAHTPSAVLFSPILGVFLICVAWRKRSWTLFATHAAAVVLALGLAAAIWLPAVAEAQYTNAKRLTEGPLRYSNHFVHPHQFLSLRWGYGFSVPGDQDGMPFTLGWAHLLVATAVLFVWPRGGLKLAATLLILICFLMTPAAHFIWDALPQLQYVVYPWRLLAMAALCLALMIGAARSNIPLLIAIIMLANLAHARPATYLSIDPLQWTPRQIAERGAVAATFDTFEPRWVQTRPAVVRSVMTSPQQFTATIELTRSADVDLPIAFFPGWLVTIDGANAAPVPPGPMGRIRLRVGAGRHRIDARFVRTPVRAFADATSLFALMTLISLLYLGRGERTVNGRGRRGASDSDR